MLERSEGRGSGGSGGSGVEGVCRRARSRGVF